MHVRQIAAGVALGVLSALVACGGEEASEGRVYASAEDVQPLAVGERVPPVRVVTVGGKSLELAELVRDHGALLVFYRGGW